MNVHVGYGLPGGRPVVDADVLAGGVELSVEIVASRSEQAHQVGTLGVRNVEERGHVSPGDDEGVAGGDGEAIADGKRGLALI